MADVLLEAALNSIENQKPHLEEWCADKRHLLKKATRLEVIEFLVLDLDAENQRTVANRLGLDDWKDLEAVQRVLRATRLIY